MSLICKRNEEKKKEPLPEQEPAYAFADIVRGLQSAISGAQDMLQAQQLQNLAGFWDTNGTPVAQKVRLGDKEALIPLVTLVPHSHLAIDDVEIKFKARVGSVQQRNMNGDFSGNYDRAFNGMMNSSPSLSQADLQVEMNGISANDNDVMEVTIKFKTKDTPEALSRLMDEYITNI